MNIPHYFLYTLLLTIISNITFSQNLNTEKVNLNLTEPLVFNQNNLNYNTILVIDTTALNQNTVVYPPTFKDYRRLGYDTGMFIGVSIIAFEILYSMPESETGWNKESMKKNGITYKWKQNVKDGSVWDKDDWFFNWITHPYSGAVYYMNARSSGFSIFESFLYSTFISTILWEYGMEAIVEIPSIQDLIITPIVGSALGEGFFYAKKSILKHDRRILKSRFLGYTTLFVIDPFNTLLDSFGYKEKQKVQLNATPVGFDKGTNKIILGLNFNMQF